MLSKKDWIKKLDEDTLKMLFSKKNILKDMPEKLKIKLSYMAKNYNKLHAQDKIKVSPIKLLLRYTFAFSMLIIVILGSFYIYQNFYLLKNRNICLVNEVKGNTYKLFFNKPVILTPGNKIKEKSTVHTDKDSSLNLKIGKNTHVLIAEHSKLKLTKLYKKKEIENTEIYLEKGEAEFNISKLAKDSAFKVQTAALSANTLGTRFIVKETLDHITTVQVYEGKVQVQLNIKIPLKKLKKINIDLYNQVKAIINQIHMIYINQEVKVPLNQAKQLEKNMYDLVEKVEISIKKNKDNNEQINNIIENTKLIINEWHKTYNEILKTKTIIGKTIDENKKEIEDKTKSFIIKKLPNNPGIILKEKNAYISTDNRYIYITSDSQKAIFSIDSQTGKLVWKFTHPLLTKITSPSVIYQEKIILCTSKNIFIIKKNGQIDTVLDINDGPVYWAKPVTYKKLLLIPANDSIYQLNGINLMQHKKIFNTPGQLYFSNIHNNLIYVYNINSRTIQVYDLDNHKSLEISASLKQRAFMPPVVNDKYIFIADSVNNLYRFDKKLQNKQPRVLKLSTGIVSEILEKNNQLYFIGNDGAFYKVNTESFNKANKIYQVDKNPDSNKYLIKKPVLFNNSIFFCSDTGKVFYYDIENNQAKLINVNDNNTNQPLISQPIQIKNALYFIDASSNIYRLTVE